MTEEPKRGTYRVAKPGQQIPDDYVRIPMYLTEAQQKGLSDRIRAEQAKDITPKE